MRALHVTANAQSSRKRLLFCWRRGKNAKRQTRLNARFFYATPRKTPQERRTRQNAGDCGTAEPMRNRAKMEKK